MPATDLSPEALAQIDATVSDPEEFDPGTFAGEIALAALRRSTLTARRTLLDAVTALEQGVERPPPAFDP